MSPLKFIRRNVTSSGTTPSLLLLLGAGLTSPVTHSETLDIYIGMAHGLVSTTYGYGELACGDKRPMPCAAGAVTASGELFLPGRASAAVFAPREVRVRGRFVGMRLRHGPCIKIRLNDKGSERFIGTRGFDLSPAAQALLTGKPATPQWSDRVYICNYKEPKHEIEASTFAPGINLRDELRYEPSRDVL